VTWERVNLGFVAAYVLVRGGEAAVVDTGTAGSESVIEETLTRVGLGWDAVGHVIFTHLHADHAGSSEAVLSAAPDAIGYAGEADLAGIAAPRPLTAVADGDRVFDLRILATPGHTDGSISVLDEVGGVLVAGDALRTDGGRPALPDAVYSDDMDEALASVAKLGELAYETLLVGHGDPIETGAAALVAELAAAR
jgi:glyoxylase-like metal-dependent hydrolase (beta-lactamase superfamily II)